MFGDRADTRDVSDARDESRLVNDATAVQGHVAQARAGLEGGNVEELIGLARERLHAAKRAGRDRVVA